MNGKLEAVRDLNLTVPAGRMYALLGPNGAGKTTTIHLLMNLLRPSSGRAEIMGVDSSRLGPRQLARIGYVSENQKIPGWMTVGQLLDFCRPFYPTWDVQLCRKLVDAFDLPMNAKIQSLSRGIRQKTAMVTAVAFRPRLLVIDEPFLGLDAAAREELTQGMLELAGEEEWTLLVASHELDDIENLVDMIGFMNGGRLLLSEERDDLLGRFREIEVKLADDGAPVPSKLPSAWLSVQASQNIIRFIDSRYDERKSADLIRRTFPQAATPLITPLSLKSIFVTLARCRTAGSSAGEV